MANKSSCCGADVKVIEVRTIGKQTPQKVCSKCGQPCTERSCGNCSFFERGAYSQKLNYCDFLDLTVNKNDTGCQKWQPLPNPAEPAGEPDWETCTQCGGLGKIPNNPHSLAIDCNKCFGIGKVDRRIALSKLLKEPPKQLAENPKWDTATINEFVDRVFKLGAYIHGADVAEILVSVADKMKEETNGT